MNPLVFALTPAGLPDPSLAIAASRAGAVGILNGEGGAPLAKLARFAQGAFGVKLSAPAPGLLAECLAVPGLGHVVLDAADVAAHGEALAAFRAAGGTLWAELLGWEPEYAGLPVDGWWAKGAESGGRVGEQMAYVLLQAVLAETALPVCLRGGIGIHTGAAALAGGAAGLVYDDQLLLLRDSPLPAERRRRLESFGGTETLMVRSMRLWSPPGARDVAAGAGRVGWGEGQAAPIGQAAALARGFRDRLGSLAAIVKAVKAAVAGHADLALRHDLLGEGSALAAAHGTRWPLVQGPMTHVSDRAGFIHSVARDGALPMAAVSLMTGDAVRALLTGTAALLGDLPWGVGLLGFVPPDVLAEQQAAIAESKPRFAIIAGGRPEQAAGLEAAGIRTYLHVPSPVLLEQFVDQGARHFVFEGRECGGHIGPLSSFTLWELMIEAVLAQPAAGLHVLLAGGIHDARSAAMAATAAAPLAARGVRVGFLMGTGYCFTREAVETGAVTESFQNVAVGCRRTVELVNGPGHASRVADTAIAEAFAARKREMEAQGASVAAIKDELESFSLGRLRLATKGLMRAEGARNLVPRPVEEQIGGGMFMIGQVAALRDSVLAIADLHQAVTGDATRFLRTRRTAQPMLVAPPPADIAVVGIGALLPGAGDARTYWENVLDKVLAIREVPADRWDAGLFFDAERATRDKVYSRWGGFLDDVVFDPVRFGMPPSSLGSIDPMQLLALAAVRQALDDQAGTADEPRRTSVILGFSGGLGEMGLQYGARAELPRLVPGLDDSILSRLPEWTEDSFAGLLPNVSAGRVANRFDFGGINVTVDAACASSLAAIYHSVLELQAGRSDRVVTGGVDTLQNPFGFLCFSKTQALSPTGVCRTFDQSADGIAIAEGLAIVVLKRLADAERDGDRIYAVIKGVGGSSDGRVKGLTAPLPAGQKAAIRRAWAQAGVSPATCGLWEAHGTGTVAGDRAELESATEILAEAGTAPGSCAIGSVKTMIGHTKAAAGVSGLVKVALALYHKVLPPHRGVTRPNPAFGPDSPLRLSQEARPWPRHPHHPRRAAVSAFGFGGTNFHAVLEEYEGEWRDREAVRDTWPVELYVWRGETVADLKRSLVAARDRAVPSELAAALPPSGPGLAIVAAPAEIGVRIDAALAHLDGGPAPAGVHFAPEPLCGEVALLFSGQGSQYPDMLRELAVLFPEVAGALEEADDALIGTPTFAGRLASRLIHPADRFGPDEEAAARAALTRTEVAQPALGAVEVGLLRLMRAMGLPAAMAAGHSYGEYVALHAAGVLSAADLFRLSEARGRFIVEAAAGADLGTMAAVGASALETRAALDGIAGVVCANVNAPRQTIVSGSRAAIAAAVARLEEKGLTARPIEVAAAFHSPLVEPAARALAGFMETLPFQAPAFPVWGNTLAEPHPADPAALRALMASHLGRPVEFVAMIEGMHRAGARLFVEIGPKSVLADLTARILAGKPHAAVALDGKTGGLAAFLNALGALVAQGVPLDLSVLFRGRRPPAAPRPMPPTAFLVNGGQARRPGETRFMGRPPAGVPQSFAEVTMSTRSYGPPGQPPADQALALYHETMRQFLQVQERVMMAYLGGGAGLPALDMPALPAFEMPAAPVTPAPVPVPAPVAAPVAVAAPAPTPAAVPAPAAAPAADLGGLLLRLVSERTGYPEDMLGLDQDLEADLGIDSIKRAEIMGAFRKAAPAPVAQVLQAEAQTFLGLGTLRAILDGLKAKLGADAPFEGAGEGQAETACALLPRYVMRAHAEPADGVVRDAVAGLHLITPDGAGLAEKLASRIEAAGGSAAIAPAGTLLDPAAMAAWVEAMGPARAVLHLAPLAAAEAGDDLATWRERMAHDVKSLFALLRAAAPGLADGGRIISASAMGGFFGRDFPGSGARRLSPGGGGLVGLIKALSLEWREARPKAVDLDPGEGPDAWIDHLIDELTLPGGRREVGYPCGARTVFRTEPASIDPLPDPARVPDADWVVLAIGGARGITAELLRELAPFRPTLVLVGRSPMPAPEGPETRGLDGPALKRRLLDEARARGEKPRPVEIDARVASLLRDREMLAATAEFVAMGARVDHRAADMRDEAQVGRLLAALYGTYGRIDAVLFGAGIIEDALLVRKTPESLDRVFDTKVDAAWLLARALRPESLRFLAFFTSVAGRYGNPGQTDYAAANETLNRFAWMLQAQWGPRVKVSAINWGPWEATTHGPGMVTPETRRQFEARGVRLVDPEGGRRFLLHEILHAPTAEVEVVAGLSPWEYVEALHGALPFPPDGTVAPPTGLPALWGARIASAEGESRLLRHRINLVNQPWLDHHRLDGQPVMPFVGALETMAESVEALGWGRVIEMRGMRLMRGIVIDGPGLGIEVRTRRAGPAEIAVEIVVEGEEKPRYRGTAVLGGRFPDPPTVALPTARGPRPPAIGHIYNRWLFHGPLFQTLGEVLALDGAGMVARCRPSRVRDFVPPADADSRWIFDIGLMDGALQTVAIWARAVQGATALPPGLASVRRFGEDPLPEDLILTLAVTTPPDEPSIVTGVSVLDGQGRVRLLLDGLEGVATRELNRLGGGWAGGIREFGA